MKLQGIFKPLKYIDEQIHLQYQKLAKKVEEKKGINNYDLASKLSIGAVGIYLLGVPISALYKTTSCFSGEISGIISGVFFYPIYKDFKKEELARLSPTQEIILAHLQKMCLKS